MVYTTIPGRYASSVPTIGENIKAIRESLGLTQEQTAEECGLKQHRCSGSLLTPASVTGAATAPSDQLSGASVGVRTLCRP